MKVYLPSWNGDMRLVSKDEERSVLELHDPTAAERIVVGAFLKVAKGKKWWDGEPPKEGDPYDGKAMKIEFGAPIAKTSNVLIGIGRPKDRTLTAVKFAGGRLEVVEGGSLQALAEIEKKIEEAKKSETAKEEAKAASVKRPTPSCPQCQPGAIGPATEVLTSFLTPEQHDDWAKHRAILVQGHLSGHRYVLAHRHTPLAQRFGRICYDVDDEFVVHFHDWSVPPEEEVLAAKLILEHAEPWLRNEATCLGFGPKGDVYKNPFGGGMDGVESSVFAQEFGRHLQAFLGL